MSLKEQLAEYRVGWYQRVPTERQAIMQRHIDELRRGTIPRTMLKVGDHAPAIVLENAKGAIVDVGALLKKGPVIVTFYRGGWCPYCNLELKAYQQILPEIAAAGASLVAISPEKPDNTLSTAEKNALSFEVLSDVGQKVGRAFGLVYEFTEELKWSSSTRTAAGRVSGCGSGSGKKARAGSNCKRRLSLRGLPPVERVGGADMMSLQPTGYSPNA
jgi:peroxiredoxin